MNAPHETQHVDLRELLRVMWRRKLLLSAPWGIAVLAGVAAAFLLQPIYFSSVTLMLEQGQRLTGPLGEMVTGRRNPEQQAEVMREQVQSSMFLRSAINASGVKTESDTRDWALKNSKDYRGMNEEQRIDAFLIDRLRESVAIKRGRGNIFEITVGNERADRAQKLAAAVASQFVNSSKAAAVRDLQATQQFALEQLQVYKKKLEESEARLESFKRAGLATTIEGSGLSEGNFKRAKTLLDQVQLDIEDQRDRVASLRTQITGKAREKDHELLTSPETRVLVGQLNGLERQLASSMLLTDPSSDNGATARGAIARKVSELENLYVRNAGLGLPGLSAETRDLLVRFRLAQDDLAAKEARREYLSSQVGAYQSQLVSGPDRDMELLRLTQVVESDRALYNAFLQQSATIQIAEAFENAKVSGRFEILEPANLPRRPGKPNRLMLIMLAFVVGGAIGVGSVLVAEHHDQSVRNTEEVESLLGLPVLGAVPRVEELERSRRRARSVAPGIPGVVVGRGEGLLHRLKVESPLGLEFRRIYLKLAKSRGRSMPTTLLVTSSMRGEGKTTTTACLAITLAREAREKLLLVDFDLRSPALHRALGLPSSSWGLAQMLHQRQFDGRFVRNTVLPHLDFLPAGKSERPAAELLDTENVEWFIHEARNRYPLVIIDSAPTLAVPDPLILGRSVEGVLYVIRAGATIRKAAEYGVKVQREARDNVLGVLLNDAGEILPHYYGYHDAYGFSPEEAGGES
jgi:capsular exopolysaccharide synthesis family protein